MNMLKAFLSSLAILILTFPRPASAAMEAAYCVSVNQKGNETWVSNPFCVEEVSVYIVFSDGSVYRTASLDWREEEIAKLGSPLSYEIFACRGYDTLRAPSKDNIYCVDD